MAKFIQLTQGKQAIVDDEDYEWLMQYKWCAHKSKKRWYAVCSSMKIGGKPKQMAMHQLILNPPNGVYCDHQDGNGLNNQRSNLRLCTNSQNSMNAKIHVNNTSGFKGVHFDKKLQKWQAQITINKKIRYLGLFATPEEAAQAYDNAAREHFGEFSKLNFPP